MPTAITHAVVAVASGKAAFAGRMPKRFWPIALLCSAGPDLDIGLMHYGVAYADMWGHRGMTHSIAFALTLSFVVTTWLFRDWAGFGSRRWWMLFTYFSLLTASHGFLDAFTNGGLGIAFFAPLNNTRYFMPWTPIEVSAIGLRGFIKYGGLQTLISEILWIWVPVMAGFVVVLLIRRLLRRQRPLAQ